MTLRKRASFTIEISLLLPAILGIIFLLLFLCFYYHDRCVIERYTYSKARMEADINNNIYRDINEKNVNELEKKLLGKWNIMEIEEIDEECITVSIEGKMNSMSGIISGFISEGMFKISISESATIKRGPDYVKNHWK